MEGEDISLSGEKCDMGACVLVPEARLPAIDRPSSERQTHYLTSRALCQVLTL